MEVAAIITIIVGVILAAFGGWSSLQNQAAVKAQDELRLSERTALKETLTELKTAIGKQTECNERLVVTVAKLSSTLDRMEKEYQSQFQDIYHWIYHLVDQIGGLRDSRHDMGGWFTVLRLIAAKLEEDDPRWKIQEQWTLPHMGPLREMSAARGGQGPR